jgi:hypothetical protein
MVDEMNKGSGRVCRLVEAAGLKLPAIAKALTSARGTAMPLFFALILMMIFPEASSSYVTARGTVLTSSGIMSLRASATPLLPLRAGS